MSSTSTLHASWAKTTVGEIATSIQYGYTASADEHSDGPRFLRITDIQNGRVNWNEVPGCQIDAESIPRFLLADGDIVFARTGATTGKSYLLRHCPKAVFASYLIRVRTVPSVDPNFVAFYFQGTDYWAQIERGKRGIGQPNVNARTLARVALPVSPANEQRRIVAKIEELFSDLDAGVAALERAKANLKRYRAAVLKAAVEGKLTEQWRAEHPDVEPASKLLERILARRRKRWEEEQLAKYEAKGKKPPKNWREKYKEPAEPGRANLPELPTGWCWATTGNLCDCIVPNRDKPRSFSGDIPWITLPDFDGEIELHSSRSGLGLSNDEVRMFRAKVVPAGSVVMSCIGRFGIAAVLASDAVVNQQLHAFLIPAKINARYLAYAIRTKGDYMRSVATATTISYLNKAKCNSVPIPVPPYEEQVQIVNLVESRLSLSDESWRIVDLAVTRASRLRQAILKRAFEGKLVPQDPSDEPASELLDGIKAERKVAKSVAKENDRPKRRRTKRRPTQETQK